MAQPYGEMLAWAPVAPRIKPLRLVVSLVVLAASVYVAAW
jgi:hypothetical protein